MVMGCFSTLNSSGFYWPILACIVLLPFPNPSREKLPHVFLPRQQTFYSKKSSALQKSTDDFSGAGNRGRTGTVSLPGDFKSPASANSAIPANMAMPRTCWREAFFGGAART